MVSLIDVVLMLLIFFMLSTSFIHPSQIRIQLPHASATMAPAHARITVTVTRNGSYLVDGRPLVNERADTLRAALRKVAGANHDQPIIVQADARASTQAIVTVMDAAGQMGFKRIDFLTTHTGGK